MSTPQNIFPACTNRQMRIAIGFAIAAVGLALPSPGILAADSETPEKPNFLFILADDVNYEGLGCYGGENVDTPAIDKLANQGIQFQRAYSATSMCAPFRAELYTGLYPYSNGCVRNHQEAKPGTKSVIHYLQGLGYRVGIIGKQHTKPESVFPWKKVEVENMGQFMNADGPWCLFYCSHNAHAPWTEGSKDHFSAEEIKLLPTQHDNRETRDVMTRYYAEVEALDQEVAHCMRALDESGKEDNTLVMFSSEQGWALGFSKWTNWNTGVHTALIARWAGVIQPGRKTEALVQMADVLPTFLEAAGDQPDKYALDGRSFLGVLTGNTDQHRDYVFGLHNNVPEGEAYAIRYIRDENFHYIWNIDYQKPYHEKHIMRERSRLVWWPAMEKAAAARDARAEALMEQFTRRPEEELYLADEDIYQLNNLAGNPEYLAVKLRLRARLEQWMREQQDPGQDTGDLP